MTIEATKPGIFADIPDDVYHASRDSLSFSGAKLLLPPSCPAKFKERMDNPPEPKPIYTFGHAAHRLILGKGAEIVEVDAPDWRSKAAREIRDTACNGIAPMLTHELDQAKAMVSAVRRHPIAGPLFEQGDAEMSMYTTDPITGITLRGRTDWMTVVNGRLTIVDFKTSDTSEPDRFGRKAASYFYHGQHAWYVDLVKSLRLHDNPDFIDVVVEKCRPHIVTVTRFDDEAVREGRRLNRIAIDLYARCTETNTWPDYTDEIATLSLPMWAINDEIEI
jgi:hypothetical protein